MLKKIVLCGLAALIGVLLATAHFYPIQATADEAAAMPDGVYSRLDQLETELATARDTITDLEQRLNEEVLTSAENYQVIQEIERNTIEWSAELADAKSKIDLNRQFIEAQMYPHTMSNTDPAHIIDVHVAPGVRQHDN